MFLQLDTLVNWGLRNSRLRGPTIGEPDVIVYRRNPTVTKLSTERPMQRKIMSIEGAVVVKAVQFCETAVESWFAIMEAQFSLAKVTESATKFYHVLSALPPQTVMKLPKT